MNLFLAATLAFSMAAGCGNSGNGANADTGDASAEAAGTLASVAESESAATESTMESESIATENTEVSESTAAEEVADATETADDSQTAEQLLVDLTGTYQELWPVILSDEYEKLLTTVASSLVRKMLRQRMKSWHLWLVERFMVRKLWKPIRMAMEFMTVLSHRV